MEANNQNLDKPSFDQVLGDLNRFKEGLIKGQFTPTELEALRANLGVIEAVISAKSAVPNTNPRPVDGEIVARVRKAALSTYEGDEWGY